MSEKTAIAWTDSTFNPVIGCTKISPGCDHCYAAEQDSRKRWDGGKVHWGPGVPRYWTSKSNWAQPRAWDSKADASGKTWRVFCGSLCDVFDNEWPAGVRDDLWQLIRETEALDWLLVTKRIGNVAKMVPSDWMRYKFPFNIRLLITVCNQEEADRDITKLLALPCKNGLSIEPQLGSVDLHAVEMPDGDSLGIGLFSHGEGRGIEWVIQGGESGSKARPFALAWARETQSQCRAAGVPYFFKQVGSNAGTMLNAYGGTWENFPTIDRAGADQAEWPEDLRVREFPV